MTSIIIICNIEMIVIAIEIRASCVQSYQRTISIPKRQLWPSWINKSMWMKIWQKQSEMISNLLYSYLFVELFCLELEKKWNSLIRTKTQMWEQNEDKILSVSFGERNNSHSTLERTTMMMMICKRSITDYTIYGK